jgi:hypothetical protein
MICCADQSATITQANLENLSIGLGEMCGNNRGIALACHHPHSSTDGADRQLAVFCGNQRVRHKAGMIVSVDGVLTDDLPLLRRGVAIKARLMDQIFAGREDLEPARADATIDGQDAGLDAVQALAGR